MNAKWYNATQPLTLLTCLLLYWLAFSAAADEPTPEISEADLQRANEDALPMFSAWLDNSGLGESLNIIRLRRARHPDHNVLPKVLCLELRWTRPADTSEEALAGFEAFDTAVAKRYGGRIGEHLLFKLINITGTPARLALVNISIQGTDIETYLDTNGRLVTVDTEVRMVSARGELPKIVTVPTTLSRIATAPMPSQLDTGQILELLDTHFSSRGGHFRRLEEVSGSYVRFLVERLNGQVISDAKYWENLQGELYAVPPDKVRLILDGKYAAGGIIGASPPSQEGFSDMEPRFVQPLQAFADELMIYITSALEENHP